MQVTELRRKQIDLPRKYASYGELGSRLAVNQLSFVTSEVRSLDGALVSSGTESIIGLQAEDLEKHFSNLTGSSTKVDLEKIIGLCSGNVRHSKRCKLGSSPRHSAIVEYLLVWYNT